MPAPSMTAEKLGTTVADNVGFDPTVIIGIIMAIIQMIQNCKKPANKADAGTIIDDEVQTLLSRRRPDKVPLQIKRAFRRNGIDDKEEQEVIWESIVSEAAANREPCCSMLVA